MAKSIWAKTLVGLVLGFIVSMSLVINIGFVVLVPRDIFLLVAVLTGFTLWAGLICWFYTFSSALKPSVICLLLLVVSAGFNVFCYIGGVQ